MKLKIFFFLIVIFSLNSKEPTQVTFDIGGNQVFLSTDSSYNKIDKFVLGWHWAQGKKMTEALLMNQAHSGNQLNIHNLPNSFADSLYITRNVTGVTANGNDVTPLNSFGIFFEPTLLINSDSVNKAVIQTNIYDSRSPVFGFKYINPGISINSTDTTLNLVTSGSYIDSTILDDVWIKDKFHFNKYMDANINKILADTTKNQAYKDSVINYGKKYTGKIMYLSVCLRRTDVLDLDTSGLSVLNIKLPYYENNVSPTLKYIRFSEETKNLYNDTSSIISSLSEYRGKTKALVSKIANLNDFTITNKMLPLNNEFIILRAKFLCEDPNDNNPLLFKLDDITSIKELGIEVKYLGNTDVAIDWIKIETENSKRLHDGEFDEDMKDAIQESIDHFASNDFQDKGVKFTRIYLRDEGGESYWSAYRYFNMLFGNIGVVETNPHSSFLFEYYTKSENRWIGSFGLNYRNIINPFYKYGGNSSGVNYPIWQYLGIAYGWGVALYDTTKVIDTLKSSYETVLFGSSETFAEAITKSNYKELNAYGGSVGGFQLEYDGILEENYYNKQNSSFLYSDKPWWAQTFILAEWTTVDLELTPPRPKPQIMYTALRNLSNEEFRLANYHHLMLGAKGLFYDGAETHSFDLQVKSYVDSKPKHRLGKTEDYYHSMGYDTLDNETFLNLDDVGSDFLIEGQNNFTNIDDYMLFDSITHRLGVGRNRIYLGQKSIRIEMYRLHKYIRANEDELMSLRLMSNYSKGFLKQYNQHPDIIPTDTLLSNFVDLTKIKTRPIGRIQGGVPLYEQSSTLDSGFYNITLLKNINNDLEDVFYLGVQNRRTDPLIYMDSTANKYLAFLSGSELEDLCKTGGLSPADTNDVIHYDSLYWQRQWFKRLGAREITLPFDYASSNAGHYNLLKVEELRGEFYDGAVKIADNSLPFHLQSKYYQHIDTVLGQDGNLVLNMLPGQGKILKVTVLRPDLSITGRLDHSNQSKLVAYPVLDSAGNETDKIQYHVVYFREDSTVLNYPNRVYYRKSYPMSKNDAAENIIWQSEHIVSDFIKQEDNINAFANFDTVPNKSCDYPSIVVRRDGGLLKAYIAYTCGPNLTANQSSVILSVLNTTNINTQTPVFNKVMATIQGSDRKWYGTPTINASAYHNYIAWSDSAVGIIAGAILPNSTNFIDKDTILNSVFGSLPFTSSSSNHPSLNTYSRINAGEDNCALVWQHSPNTATYYKNILYTRLKVVSGDLRTYSGNAAFRLNKQNNICRLNTDLNTPSSNQFPVVYRYLDSLNYATFYNRTFDAVAWQSTYANYQRSSINGRTLGSLDLSTDSSDFVSGGQVESLQDNYRYSFLPDLGQQSALVVGNEIKFPYGKYVLNFVRGNNIGYQTYNMPATNSWVTDANILGSSYKQLNQISSSTKQPHLAKYKEPNIVGNLWRNRRVYEEYISNNYSTIPKIVSNGRFFYKNNVTEELGSEAFVGFNKGVYKYQVSVPSINDQQISLILPLAPITDSAGTYYELDNSKDTVFSNWFNINLVGELNFKCYGFNDSIMKAKLQRQSDNRFFDLNLPLLTTDTTGKLGEYTLINGGLNSYRLCFIRLDTNYQYTETLVLEGLPVSDTVSLKSNESTKQIVDLSGSFNLIMGKGYFNIAISPNPADDIVYMTPLYSDLKNGNLIEVEILDNLGNSIYKKMIKSGETFSFVTNDLSQGIYIVNCKEITSDWLAPNFLKADKFIISR